MTYTTQPLEHEDSNELMHDAIPDAMSDHTDDQVTDAEYNRETTVDAMLTTYDNPYNPYDDYDAWWQWDKDNGYNTPELLAMVLGDTSDALDAVEEAQRTAVAMNWIIDEGPIEGVWTTIKKNVSTPIRLPTTQSGIVTFGNE
nr:MAG TPA: hypothetical protein [Caudoviricetes sp.]